MDTKSNAQMPSSLTKSRHRNKKMEKKKNYTIFYLNQIVFSHKIKNNEINGAFITHTLKINHFKDLRVDGKLRLWGVK
jgi:hypothetical protein